jgi:hypothetical protein
VTKIIGFLRMNHQCVMMFSQSLFTFEVVVSARPARHRLSQVNQRRVCRIFGQQIDKNILDVSPQSTAMTPEGTVKLVHGLR